MAEQKKEPSQTQGTEGSGQETNVGIRRTGQGSASSGLERQGRQGALGNWYGASSPFALMRRMMEDMDRMFEGFGSFGALSPRSWPESSSLTDTRFWTPQIEVAEQNGQLVVRADLPGTRKEDIELEVQEDALVLRGHRHAEREEKRGSVSYSERNYGSFSRVIPLPTGVRPDQVQASFDHGVLEVSLKLPEESRRKIEIRSASAAPRASEGSQAPSQDEATASGGRSQPANGNQPRS